MAWVFYSFIAAVGFGVIALLLTYLSRSHMSSLIVNTWFWTITAAIFILTSLLTAPKQIKIQGTFIKWFVLLAVVAVITNFFSVKALQVGPNTGIVRSIQMIQIIVATLGGIYLFHEGITIKTGFGIGLVVSGVLLLINK